ncbi:cytosolic carboxypeptidase 1-like isoform X3 [Argiope bruennichi]|uniref:tubulin-glutamate carboxypeptidase n=1 Tax=Argiope bruennichi TaxID=94029 RepID=A0A8T0E4R6_ARGBR|nr:cytosolic carboxypeptidase 1-like isoform X3 [Argiope bruennichi]KAF8764234.1 Cytosolic carboxypeptidase 1 like protein [Argiope bruennichi]
MEKDVKPSEDPLSVVNSCIESLEKLVNLKTSSDRALYVGSIERLQHAVCSEDSAMKHFVSSYSGGIPLLVAILEKSQDQHIRHFAVLIIEKMLLHKSGGNEHAQAFVFHGAVDHLLKLIVKCQLSWGDDFISSLYKVTARIGDEDKKFAVKARFLGVLPVIVTHIRTYAKRYKVLNTIMRLLKKIMASSVNATKLCKDGLPRELLHFLDEPKKMTIIPVLEAISEATRTRHAARQFVKDDVISRVLQIIFSTNAAGCNRINSSICKTGLKVLVHLTQIKIGREKLLSAGTIPSLLSWCRTLLEIPGNRYNTLVSLVSNVIQRCLPPRPLPVKKLNNPVNFSFSESYNHNESDSSDGKNDDTLSLASSTMSSADSASDSDEQEMRPLDLVESSYGESVEHFAVFFDEMNETQQIKPHFAAGDDMQSEDFKDDFYDKYVSSPVIEFKDLKLTSLIPKLVPKQPCPPLTKKEMQRKIRKPTTELSHCMKERQPKTTSVTTLALCGQGTCGKPPAKRANLSDTTCDINAIPSSQLNGDKNCQLLRFERQLLLESAREESRNQKFIENVSLSDIYHKQSFSTVSVSPLVKLAYPDIMNYSSDIKLETPLLKQDPFLLRHKIYKYCEEMAQNDRFYTEIYNLDTLMNESSSNFGSSVNIDHHRIQSEKQYEHLQFEARFESGNLRKVFWKGGEEYDLILNPDINSKGHIQWFYFEVSGMKANCPYTFNIINMEKSTSQFNEGMCPVMFSVRNHMEKKQGWIRAGSDICYFRNHYTQGPSTNSILRNKPYYTLTFTVTFEHTNDVCYLAYHYPYTFTTLQTHLYYWLNSYDTTSIYFKKDELCRTLAGNSVPLLTITSKPLDTNRPYIFLTARVHPGESNSSWVMKGSLDFLLSNKAQKLRDSYIFKVVPMLNPDGVINGCHRLSLSGQDLNRQWITPNAHLHPTIYYTKSLFHYLASKSKKPQAFCDYHGHSRRSNAFFFGCNPEQSWWPSDETKPDCESFKILPILMDEMAPTFSLEDCDFTIERCRESTGRVTVWRQFDVALSYTLECSYGGCSQGKYAGYHMGIPQLEDTGMKLCQCFGKLVIDAHSNRVWSSIPIDVKSFPLSSFEKPSRSKFCTSSTSTETDDEFDDCDEDEQTI